MFACVLTLSFPTGAAWAQSCEGRCGGQSTAGCWCDIGCLTYNDCCPTFTQTCLRPTIAATEPVVLPTAGGGSLDLRGTNFQPPGSPPPTVRIGAAACTVTSSSSDRLLCTIPPGDTTEDIVVTNALNLSSSPRPISRRPPQVDAVSAAGGLPTRGGPIDILGRDLGINPTVTVNGLPCSVTSASHVAIRCQAPPGAGVASTVVTSPAGLSSSPVGFLYRAPSLTSATVTWDEDRAAWRVVLRGNDLGPADAPITVTVGGVACAPLPCGSPAECSASHDERVCIVTSAAGTFPTSITVAGATSNSLPVTVPTRELSVAGGPFATAGGSLLSITGAGFGVAPGTVEVAGASCPVAVWTNTLVQCTVPPGQGTGVRVVLRTAGGVAFPEISIQYAPPAVTGASPSVVPTTGGQEILLQGGNFGLSATVELGSLPAPVVQQSHTSLRVVAPAVAGANLPLIVTVAGQASVPFPVSTFAPSITSTSVQWLDGRPILTLNGLHFGAVPGSVRVDGETLLTASSWTQSEIRVPVTPSAAPQSFEVVRGGQSSDSWSVTVAPAPVISSVSPAALPVGGGPVDVNGSHFLPGGRLFVDDVLCEGGSATSTRVTCALAPDTTDPVFQIRRADGAVSNAVVVPRQRPSIQSVTPIRLTTAAGASITLDGAGFPAGATVSLGTDDCPITSATGSRIVCTAPAQDAGTYPVTVAAGALRSQSAFSVERVACEPGTAGTATCAPCPQGTFSTGAGAATCTPCPGGRVPNAGQTACVACSPGTFALPGASECSPCAEGTVADGVASIACIPCPAGSAPDASRTVCELCAAGTFAASGDASCAPCGPGTVAPSFGAAMCSSCPGGRVPGAGATMCLACPLGTFALPGSATCDDCPAGTVASSTGALACDACPAGSVANSSKTVCELCPAGSFSSAGGTCALCPQGTFSNEGAAVCTRCPLTSAAPPGSTACVPCLDGVSDDGARCIACGDGFVDGDEECDDGLANADEADACRLDCTLPFCGDGIVDDGELCDEGDANDDEEPGACRLDCTAPFCGDGVVDPGEACDDGLDNVDDLVDACGTDCTINVDPGGHDPGDDDADAGAEDVSDDAPDDAVNDADPDDADDAAEDVTEDAADATTGDVLADASEDTFTDAVDDPAADVSVDAPGDVAEDATIADTDRSDATRPDATDAALPPDAPRTDTTPGDDVATDGISRDDSGMVDADVGDPVRIGGGSTGGCSAAPGAPASLWALLIGAVLFLRRRTSVRQSGGSA